MARTFFKKILVAVNGHKNSIHTAMYAIMMARTYNLALKIIYVVDSATIKYLEMNNLLLSEEKSSFLNQLTQDGVNILSYVAGLARSKGVKIESELLSGGVFNQILKAAEDFNADLILMGGHEDSDGKSGLKKSILSRDQNEILANAPCPVLIVQKPNIEAEFKIF